VADGWQPIHFIPERFQAVWGDALRDGTAKSDPALGPLQLMAGGTVAIGSSPVIDEAPAAARAHVGFYVGGMGAWERNFYNELFQRYGWKDEAKEIQDLFLAGKREEACAKVPEEYLDLAALSGDPGKVRDRIDAFRAVGVSYLNVTVVGDDPLHVFEQLKSWA
jgi:alkanesulfonate monooxygenase SsuD/methylene tetrahydromethanopterin reductase-like flavin-dependent oxidoreductase (luciferase family)